MHIRQQWKETEGISVTYLNFSSQSINIVAISEYFFSPSIKVKFQGKAAVNQCYLTE